MTRDQHDQRLDDSLFAAVFLWNPAEEESTACPGYLQDDDEDDQLGGLETIEDAGDNGSVVHEHHDAVIIDEESHRVLDEFFIAFDVSEGGAKFFESMGNGGFTGRQFFRFVDLFDIEEHRDGS